MSFSYHARKVRDRTRPPWQRLSNLRSCVSSFCWLTGHPYRATLERLELVWLPWQPRDPPSDEFLQGTLEALERERNRYLEGLRAFERRRIRAKHRGDRQLSKAERARLRGLLREIGGAGGERRPGH
ncbi:MAG TPA: hypothetical protein VHG28_15260 [Longimicrobiaceae bacterium]|nr:hypothetical protein [Longimicrobiaceae bacterium]